MCLLLPYIKLSLLAAIRQEVLSCEGNSVLIGCPVGYHLAILEAFYGRNDTAECSVMRSRRAIQETSRECSDPVFYERMRDRCGRKNQCQLTIDKEHLGNPCQNEAMTLTVKLVATCTREVTGLAK